MKTGFPGIVTGLALLAGCSDAISPESADYLALYDENVALVNEVAAMPVATTLPTGTLAYFGTAGIAMDTDPGTSSVADTSILGDAVLVADFSGDDITGSMGNFVAVINGQPARYLDGELEMSNGDLQVVSVSQFTADVNGILSGPVDVVVVDAAMVGNFRFDGVDTDALYAVSTSALGDESHFYLNGTEYSGLLAVVAVE